MPPYTGPTGYEQVSPTASGPAPQPYPPYQQVPLNPQAVKRSTAAPILVGVAAMLFLVAAVMTGLYFNLKSHSEKTIASQRSQISTLENTLTAKNDELSSAQRSASDARSDAGAAKAKTDVAMLCVKAAQDSLSAVRVHNDPAFSDAYSRMIQYCEHSGL